MISPLRVSQVSQVSHNGRERAENAQDSTLEPGHSASSLMPSEGNRPPGDEEGEYSPLEGQHEPHEAGLGPVGTPRGAGDGNHDIDDSASGEDPVRVDDVLERFARNTTLRLKDGSRKDFARAFRRFAGAIDLGRYSRRQIAGPMGKRLILQHLETIPKASRRWVLTALKSVWIHGFELPWPIDPKRDIGRLPKPQRGRTPPDADVRPWVDGANAERDAYSRLMVLMLLQFGWRPTQIAHLKWRNVEYDGNGKPFAIVANGDVEDFKTSSDVRAWLPPNVAEAIETWRKASPDTSSERPILPRKGTTARLKADPARMHDRDSFRDLLRAFERKWGLPHLSAKAFRHFVATMCRKAGLSYQASAYLQGHDPSSSGAMRDWYDNPDDAFAEQSAKLPGGPMGLLEPPKIVSEGLPSDAARIVADYLAGRIGTMELASRLEALRQNPAMSVLVPSVR